MLQTLFIEVKGFSHSARTSVSRRSSWSAGQLLFYPLFLFSLPHTGTECHNPPHHRSLTWRFFTTTFTTFKISGARIHIPKGPRSILLENLLKQTTKKKHILKKTSCALLFLQDIIFIFFFSGMAAKTIAKFSANVDDR